MIKITEILPNPKGKDANNEWIELTNTSDIPANLTGWTIDDSEGGSKPYKIPQLTIPPQTATTLNKSQTNINLNNSNDEVRLFNNTNTLIDSLSYGKSEEGKSYAETRILSETGEKSTFHWTTPTPNSPNQPLYRLEGIITESPQIADEFFFKFQPKNSNKILTITFTDPPLDFETAQITLIEGTPAKLLISKPSNTEFSLIDYKIGAPGAPESSGTPETSQATHIPKPHSTPLTYFALPIIIIVLTITITLILKNKRVL
jgi:hypothetical protein